MSEAERKVGDSRASSQPQRDDNLAVIGDEYLVVVASVRGRKYEGGGGGKNMDVHLEERKKRRRG